MSLVTVMVAMGIASILGLALMEMSNTMSKMWQTSEIQSETQQQMMFLQAGLSDEHTCLANFGGLVVGSTALEIPTDASHRLRAPASATSLTLGEHSLLPSQDPRNLTQPISVGGMSLRLYEGLPNLAVLQVRFEPKDKSIFGGTLRPREMPLRIETDASHRITRCAANATLSPEPQDTHDEADNGDQGRACKVPGSTAMHYPTGNTSRTYPVNARDFSNAIQQICERQTYPIQNGLVIPKADLQHCVDTIGFRYSASIDDSFRQCAALALIAGSENSGNWVTGGVRQKTVPADVVLTKRNGYADKQACLQQKNFSEGDTLPQQTYGSVQEGASHDMHSVPVWSGFQSGPLCINGHWTGPLASGEPL